MTTTHRIVDRAVAPNCPACSSALPRVVRTSAETETWVHLRCPVCAFEVSYVGPGLIVDRRGSKTIER